MEETESRILENYYENTSGGIELKSIVNILKGKKSFVSLKGANPKEISIAEKELKTVFAPDYHEYVSTFGAASYYGHELTGVCKSNSLNVVDVTLLEREFNSVPMDWYVIEQTNIDGIVYWQSSDGKIYQTRPNKKPIIMYDSLLDYINQV